MYGTWRRHWRRIAPVLAIGLLGILVAAPNAAGQAALKQYVPVGNPAGGNGRSGGTLANPIATQTPGPGAKAVASQDKGSAKGGTLPLTDYPGTPWLWIVIAILIAAAVLRGGIYVLKRRGLLRTA